MSNVVPEIHEQSLSRLSAAGTIHAEHVTTYSKVLDLSYEMDRKMVSLVQSLGIREVTSQSGHLGIPNASQTHNVANPT